MLKMSSCAHSPSERMYWIVRGGEERCDERCGKMCCGVGRWGVKGKVEGGVVKCVGV